MTAPGNDEFEREQQKRKTKQKKENAKRRGMEHRDWR
jgi:hypothetical protein